MSLCDGSYQLLESYGIFTNVSEGSESAARSDAFKHWCHYERVSIFAHYFIGIILILICIMSILGNFLVIVIFTNYRRLRSPANTLIVNLACSDMFNGFLHPLAAYSAFHRRWMFEKIGCEVYAGLCGLFGLVSIVTLTAIAIERCLVISVKPWYGSNLFTQVKAKLSCFVIWFYCIGVVLPPYFGWGAFVPEGFLTSCSFDYITRTPCNRSYFFYIFFVGFFFPVMIIVVCYVFIMRTIYQNEMDLKRNNVKKANSKPRMRNDYKAAEMIMIVIGMFLASWIPYCVIAMIGQFGNTRVLTPWVSVLPSLFAKMSTIYNPAIYGLSHRHFRGTLRQIFKKDIRHSMDQDRTYASRNSSIMRSKNHCLCYKNCSTDIGGSSSSFSAKNVLVGVSMATNILDSRKIVYVKSSSSDRDSCRCELAYEVETRLFQERKASKEDSFRRSTLEKTKSIERTVGHSQPIVFAIRYDPSKHSLLRSQMFKSESSIHQKYKTYLEEDHIVKIPSSICTYGTGLIQKKCEVVLLSRQDVEPFLPMPLMSEGLLNASKISVQQVGRNNQKTQKE